jgi:hypothetical protein
VGGKLAEGKGLREGWYSKELWKSVGKLKPHFSRGAKDEPPAPPEVNRITASYRALLRL